MNAIRIVEGDLRVGDLRILLVASRFNESIVDRLVQGAVDAGAAIELANLMRKLGD